MGLREVLTDWHTPQLDLPPHDLRPLELAARKVAQMAQGKAPVPPPKGVNIEEVAANIRGHLAKGGRLNSFSSRDMRAVAWVMFHAEGSAPNALASEAAFWPDYMKWLQNQKSTRSLKTVLQTFLFNYPQEMGSFRDWRNFLDNQLRSSRKTSLRYWRESNRRYGFFQRNGIYLAAVEIWSNWQDWGEAFDAAGFSGLMGDSAFAKEVFGALLEKYQNNATKRPAGIKQFTRRLLKFAVSPESGHNELRYKGLGAALINSLLLPYDSGGGLPADKEFIKKFLQQHFGDPRIRSASWASVHDKAREQMMRWLVEDSLDLFLEILSATADPMWKYRKEFWRKYLTKGVIDEAWPVLGSLARSKAASIEAKPPYGHLYKATSDQSVLLLRINDLVIAEWSHSGACRIWTRETRASRIHAPKLYKFEYDGPDLRSDCEERVIHSSPSTYSWQKKLEGIIRNYTGIRVKI